jgi:hypothetical protein
MEKDFIIPYNPTKEELAENQRLIKELDLPPPLAEMRAKVAKRIYAPNEIPNHAFRGLSLKTAGNSLMQA